MTDRALLLRYGRHDDDCAVCRDSACMPKPACTCGFAAALTPAASLGAVDRLREIEADLNSAAISSGEIGLRGACIDARNKLREIRRAALDAAIAALTPTPEHPQSACLECRGKCPTPKLCADARARGAAPTPEGREPMWPTDPWEALRRIEGMGGQASYVARECLRATQQEGGS